MISCMAGLPLCGGLWVERLKVQSFVRSWPKRSRETIDSEQPVLEKRSQVSLAFAPFAIGVTSCDTDGKVR
jgi:hypothetical protein